MNKTLEEDARKHIKNGLKHCTDEQQLMFKRMYSHQNLEKEINQVVDCMPAGKLETALDQVERTAAKNMGF